MNLKHVWVLALCMPLMAFAAAESAPTTAADETGAANDNEFRVTNPHIDTWAVGIINQIGKNGEMTASVSTLPFASAHAQMRQEMHQKLANVEDPQQRFQIVKQTRDAWRDKLGKAMEEKRGVAKELTFKQPADSDDLVVLNSKTIRELPGVKKAEAIKERREQMDPDERCLSDLYQARQERVAERRAERRAEQPQFTEYQKEKLKDAAGKISEKAKERVESGREKIAGERLSTKDLKQGDKILIGYDSKSNTAYTIIQKDESK